MVLFSNKRSMNARFRDLCKNISILKYRTFLTMYQVVTSTDLKSPAGAIEATIGQRSST